MTLYTGATLPPAGIYQTSSHEVRKRVGLIHRSPHLPIESADRVVCEEPLIGSELRQLNPAEVSTVSRQQRRHGQQGVRQLEEVAVAAPEFLAVDLRGVPLEGRGGHVWTRFQDSAPSGRITQSEKGEMSCWN